MTRIAFADGAIEIDADLLAKAFRIDTGTLKQRMRAGAITSRAERGADDDAGKVRLTFFSSSRRVRIIADDNGNIISTTAVDYGELPLPLSSRRAG